MSENKDPVCGMEVEAASAAATREYNGETFYFCSPGCAKNFDADPARYVRQTQTENHPNSEPRSDAEQFHHETQDHSIHSVVYASAPDSKRN